MNPLEETTIRLVAEGEATKGRIVLKGNNANKLVFNSTTIINRKIPLEEKQKIYTMLDRRELTYSIENWNVILNNIYSYNGKKIRNITETENIWFAQNEEALRSPDFIDSRDFERILNTNYVQSDENLINMIKQYR